MFSVLKRQEARLPDYLPYFDESSAHGVHMCLHEKKRCIRNKLIEQWCFPGAVGFSAVYLSTTLLSRKAIWVTFRIGFI